MRISKNGLDLLKKLESCRLKAYQDVAGIWTIGYGTTRIFGGRRVRQNDIISKEEAEFYLEIECNEINLEDLVDIELNQNQIDALICLIYNIGVPAFKSSTLRRHINLGLKDKIGSEWMKWDKAHINGELVEVEGLKNRRRMEYELWSYNVETDS